ncbi:MAG: glycosyltransferase family 39 protein [Anaerolineae bacterium]|nr:glycosyltransferase family 39 protein [Anaerolineae bacterium]
MRSSKFWYTLLIFLLALIVARFAVVGLPKILFNHLSSDGDESAYLALGLALRESGVLSDGTRPPLYALQLAPFAKREWSYFTTAKLVTLGTGALAVLAVFAAGASLFGWRAGLLAAFLLAANKEFHIRAATVYADTLLALIMVGAWYFLIKSLARWKYCLLAGLFVGLAFLTKGSAPVLLAAWGLTALLYYRLKVIRHFELLLVPLVFIIVSLPLLIYNANEFGSPTYNFATQHIMWMDQLEQINTEDPADLPTFSTYMDTHTPADILARIQKGLRRLNPVVAHSLIPGRTFKPPWLGPVLGALVIGLFIFLIVFQRRGLRAYLARRKNILWFTFFLCALFYLFFTWYVAGSSAETRFIVPLLGPIYLVLADAVVNLMGGVERHLTSSKITANRRSLSKTRLYRLVLALIIGGGTWWLIDTFRVEAWALTVNPYESDRSHNAEEEEIVQWLSTDRPAGKTLVTFGPSKSLPLWKFPAHFTFERLPVEVDSWPAMEGYVQARRPDYLIVDDDTARRRRQALAGYFQRDNELIVFEQLPPNWALDLAYPGLPCKWCIFSPVREVEPLAALEGGLELVGYEVISPPNNPASRRVILAWRAQKTPAVDYTVFVHLTAPDGFVKAQQDQQPFGGTLPTSRWRPNEVLADRYDLTLEAGVTPGQYLLLTGMYNPATSERLKVIDGPSGPVPDSVLLGTLEIAGD